MFSLAHMSTLVLAGALGVLTVAFLAFLAILALRFMRRGSARSWAAPGGVALSLLPAVLAAGVTTLAFRATLGGLVLTGAGGVAALAAGSAEALIPLLVGLAATAGLALVGLLLTAIGSSRATEDGLGGGLALPAAALVAVPLSASLVVLSVQVVGAVNAGQRGGQALLLRLNLSLAASALLALLLLGLALATALRAPRGASPLGVKLSALLSLSLCGFLALAGLWVVQGEVQSYLATALTGASEDALPE